VGELREALGERWHSADAAILRGARRTWDKLAGAVDAQRMIYVAGVQPETVCGHVLADDDGAFRFNRRKLLFPVTPEGDGTVTWASGDAARRAHVLRGRHGARRAVREGFRAPHLRRIHRTAAQGHHHATAIDAPGHPQCIARMRFRRCAVGVEHIAAPQYDCLPTEEEIGRLTFGPGSAGRLPKKRIPSRASTSS
jgi:hypothetical protein